MLLPVPLHLFLWHAAFGRVRTCIRCPATRYRETERDSVGERERERERESEREREETETETEKDRAAGQEGETVNEKQMKGQARLRNET